METIVKRYDSSMKLPAMWTHDVLHEKVVAHCLEWGLDPKMPDGYVAGLRAVLASDEDARHVYAQHSRPLPLRVTHERGQTSTDAHDEADRLTREYMTKKGETDYVKALHAVLDDPQNADLKEAYARI